MRCELIDTTNGRFTNYIGTVDELNFLERPTYKIALFGTYFRTSIISSVHETKVDYIIKTLNSIYTFKKV